MVQRNPTHTFLGDMLNKFAVFVLGGTKYIMCNEACALTGLYHVIGLTLIDR